mgnify:CR=1 FL=1
MNSGRIAIGFIIIMALAGMMFLRTSVMPSGYAASSVINSTTASVTVNGVVEVTIQNAAIAFGGLDSGISNSAATNNPLNISFGANTNVNVKTYINGSATFNATSSSFAIGNMTFNATTSATGGVNASCSTARCNYRYAPFFVLNETAPLGTAKNASIYHYISVPAGQLPGPYTGSVRICTEQDGASTACET